MGIILMAWKVADLILNDDSTLYAKIGVSERIDEGNEKWKCLYA